MNLDNKYPDPDHPMNIGGLDSPVPASHRNRKPNLNPMMESEAERQHSPVPPPPPTPLPPPLNAEVQEPVYPSAEQVFSPMPSALQMTKDTPDPGMAEHQRDMAIVQNKEWRRELDDILQRIKNAPRNSRERKLTITKLQEAIMWLGMDLKEMNTPNPYPNSKDPSNTKIDPTADGLKM